MAELAALSQDSAELTLAIQDHHKQQHGFVHGGVISYLADNAIAFAGGLALGGNALMAEFKINYQPTRAAAPPPGCHGIASLRVRPIAVRTYRPTGPSRSWPHCPPTPCLTPRPCSPS